MRRTSWLLCAALGCASSSTSNTIEPDAPRPKVGAAWFTMRAQQLGVSMTDAKKRDATFDPGTVPTDFWNPATATNTGAVWNALCAECHGGQMDPGDAAKLPAPAVGWGTGTGRIFAEDRPLPAAYAKIFDGSDDPKKMPPWKDKLSREQIWALVHFVEQLSNTASARVYLEKK